MIFVIDKKQSELLKGLAVILLVYYHSVSLMGEATVIVPYLKMLIAKTGNVCVVIFAYITVYGLTKKLIPKNNHEIIRSYIQFIANRLLSLYHSYWPAFFLGFIVALFRQVIYAISGQGAPVLTDTYGTGLKGVFHAGINFLGMSHLKYGNGYNTLNQTWWYMSLAIVLIFAIPICVIVCRYINYWAIPLSIAMAFMIPIKYFVYMPLIIIGILAAQNKIKNHSKYTYMLFVCCICVWGMVRIWFPSQYNAVADSLVVYPLIQIITLILRGAPDKILTIISFLGSHSANIFYLHSFVYIYWPTSKWVYMFKYGFFIFLITMICSIGLSVLLDWIKDKVLWNDLFNVISNINILKDGKK